uniref:F-box domain-containing protein n=1 Tax=Caenorhabditis japonica TaxID=281687 RepID=A0A8R1DQT3_CAEJA
MKVYALLLLLLFFLFFTSIFGDLGLKLAKCQRKIVKISNAKCGDSNQCSNVGMCQFNKPNEDSKFIWPNLPTKLKKHVVKRLDYVSRCRLRKCSTSDQELVDSCPMHWNGIYVSLTQASLHIRFSKVVTMEYFRKNNDRIEIKFIEGQSFCKKTREVVDSKLNHYNVGIADFLLMLKNQSTTCQEINFQNLESIDTEDQYRFIQSLLFHLSSMNSSWKIHSKKLYTSLVTTSSQLLDILSFFCPNTLKCITMKEYSFNAIETKALVNTGHWRNAECLDLQHENNISIAEFLHSKTFWTVVPKLEPSDAWAVIENYREKDGRPRGSTFYIRSISPLEIQNILNEYDVPVDNMPVESPWRKDSVLHTQKFPIAGSELVLVVMLMKFEITGKLCLLSNIEEDCYNYYTADPDLD